MKTSFRPLVSSLLAAAILATGASAWADPAQRPAGPAPSGKPTLQTGSLQSRPSILTAPLPELHVKRHTRGIIHEEADTTGGSKAKRPHVAFADVNGDGIDDFEFAADRQSAPTTRGEAPNRGYLVGNNGTARAASPAGINTSRSNAKNTN